MKYISKYLTLKNVCWFDFIFIYALLLLQRVGIINMYPFLCFADCGCVEGGSQFSDEVGAVVSIAGILVVQPPTFALMAMTMTLLLFSRMLCGLAASGHAREATNLPALTILIASVGFSLMFEVALARP